MAKKDDSLGLGGGGWGGMMMFVVDSHENDDVGET